MSDPELQSIKCVNMDCESCQSSALYILYFCFFFKVPFQNNMLWSLFFKAPISGDLAKMEVLCIHSNMVV